MQEKRKRSKTSIIIAVVAVVLLIAVMIVWRQYEAEHKDELEASVLTTDVSQAPIEEDEPEPEPAVPKQVIPDDPDELLVMAEEALKDEGYFEKIGRDRGKGDHVHFLLKKCLTCEGDPGKVEGLAKRLKELSNQGYGPWRVDSADLDDLDERIKAAKQI